VRDRPILNYKASPSMLDIAGADILNRYSEESATKASHVDSYNAWCRYKLNTGRPNCVVSVDSLRQFTIYEHLRGISSDTTKVRLGGIGRTLVKKRSLTQDQWDAMRTSSDLNETRSAIRRLELKLGYEHRRADPISFEEVKSLAVNAVSFDQVVLSLMIATAFFGLNRMGELADNSSKDRSDILKLPRFGNLRRREDSISFVIQSTKVESWQEKIVEIEHCPDWYLKIWDRYIAGREQFGLKYCPFLFVMQNGMVPTSTMINEYMKSSLPRELTTHSCRAGGATYMALLGKSFIEIMIAGRWNSWAFIKYIRGLVKMEKAMKAAGSLPPGYKI
jgi:hypothetical protein